MPILTEVFYGRKKVNNINFRHHSESQQQQQQQQHTVETVLDYFSMSQVCI